VASELVISGADEAILGTVDYFNGDCPTSMARDLPGGVSAFKLVGAHPYMASCGPALRSRFVKILDVAGLRLRVQRRCGFDLNRNLPFLEGHGFVFGKAVFGQPKEWAVKW
jgi:hypothetical protein